jgi:alpha-glucosidase (family GH31 glycosyl hydrolase)
MLLPAVIALVAAASAATAAAEPIAAAATASDWSNTYDDGTTIKVSSIGSGIVRVKTVPRGAQEDFSSVDLTLPQPQPPPALAVTKTPAGWTLATAELRVHVSSSAATADVARADGTMLSQEHAPPAALPEAQCGVKGGGFIAGGCLRASRSLQGEEEMFGGGVQLYSGPAQRGKKLFMRTNAVVGDAHPGWSHTVAPLFFSSRGYGLLVNTHAYTYFDIGATESGHTVTPPPPGIVCDTKWGDPIGGNTSALVLKCPTGGKISAVTFASYGTPKGDCGHFKTGHCAQDRTAAMKKLCLGKAECSVKVSNDCEACPNGTCTEHCGDPCWGNAEKHLSVSVECKGQPVQPPPPAPPVVPASNLIHVADPVVDLFFFAGPTNHAVLEQFTALTGRMSMPPKWAMGLWYHPQEHSNQTVVLDIVESFKKNDVPLAALTLEPPWQTHAYSCSYVWNPAMFWDPAGFIKTLNAKDVQLTLWEHGYVYNGTAEEGAKCVAEPCPRPTPPCPSGWWEGKGPASPAHPGTGGSGTCNQGCPSDSQARDPTSGRCLCGEQSWGCNDVFHCAKPSAAEGKGTCVDGGAPGAEVSPLFMPLLENDCAADWCEKRLF